jgi:nitrogen regulatory protein P-II 1
MKRIEAIIRTTKVGDVCTALEKVGHPGIMISEIEGHGTQKGVSQEFRGKTFKVDFLTKAVLEVVAKDEDVEGIVKAICDAAHTGEVGDGKIFIHPVADALRIRTGERGDKAL